MTCGRSANAVSSDADALEVFIRSGPTGQAPADWVLDHVPDEVTWRRSLGHQTRLRVTAAEALASVRTACHLRDI